MRVMTWNVMGTGGREDRSRRLPAAVAAVDASGCDLLLLQEAWPEVVDAISARSGLQVAASSGYLDGVRVCAVMCRGSAATGRRDGFGQVMMPGSQSGAVYLAVGAEVRVGGRVWGAVSAHLPWGGRSEAARLAGVRAVDARAASLWSGDVPVVLGADMNAVPEAASWRALTGLDPSDGGCFWVDCFAAAGAGAGFTAGPGVAPLALMTAGRDVSVVRPDLDPDRRYDGIFARGWCHGRTGGPVGSFVHDVEAAREASDHLPVVADLIS